MPGIRWTEVWQWLLLLRLMHVSHASVPASSSSSLVLPICVDLRIKLIIFRVDRQQPFSLNNSHPSSSRRCCVALPCRPSPLTSTLVFGYQKASLSLLFTPSSMRIIIYEIVGRNNNYCKTPSGRNRFCYCVLAA